MANFTTSAKGGFVAPNGQSWSMRGLDMDVKDALPAIQGSLLQDYPGLTAIRLVCNAGADTAQSLAPIIDAYTSKGIVVELEDHWDTNNGGNTGWYSSIASAYKDNPYVFLETPNEPAAGMTGQPQIDIINAIRATGFANPIGIQPIGGYDQSNIPTVLNAVGTSNLYVTPHIYYNGTDPNAAAQYVQSEVQQAASNGLFAVIDEFGNALDGYTMDPQGNTVIQAVVAANQAGQAGAIFWAADNGNHPDGADSAFLTPDGSQLTSTGKMIQPWLSQATTPTGGTPTPTPTPAPTPTPTPSPTPAPSSVNYVTPGSGSFKDGAGNVYTIDSSGNADENGNPIPGGAGTSAMELSNGTVYGQDATTKSWYTWNQSAWNGPVSAPPAPTTTPTPNPTPTPTPSPTPAPAPAPTPSPTPAPTPAPTPSPTPAPTPAPTSASYITPGSGSFKDTAGNVYTVDGSGNADENGNPIPGGAGTGAMELSNNTVYGQDAATKSWYTWDQTTWTGPVSAPPTPTSSPSASPSPTPTPTPTTPSPIPTPTTITIPATTAQVTENVSNAVIQASAGSHMVFINGTGDTVKLTGGAETVQALQGKNTITTGASNDTIQIGGSDNTVDAGAGKNVIRDGGTNNTIVIPAASKGYDDIYGSVLTNGDKLNLHAALQATGWNGSSSTIANFLHVKQSGSDAIISISATAGGAATNVADLHGAGTVSLQTLLAHSTT